MLFNYIVFNKEINMLKYTQLCRNYLKSLFSHQNNVLIQQNRVIFSINLQQIISIKLNINFIN